MFSYLQEELDQLRSAWELTLPEADLQESRWVFAQPAFAEEVRRWRYTSEDR